MTEEQKQWFDKLAKDREDSAKTLEKPSMRGIKSSVVEKYSDQAHFIYELLQNANDAKATKSSFQLTTDGLYFRHNGKVLFSVSNPEHSEHGKMHHNDSGKHESNFVSVKVQENNSIMLKSLAGSTLGVWISHGEGKFHLPESEDKYNIVAKYGYDQYPHNPNGSDYNTAMLCDKTGRHLVTMPHIERSIFQWNWAHYPVSRQDKVSPWLEAFVNARKWCEEMKNY